MNVSLKVVLMVAAVVCFGLATANIAQGRLVPAGLFCLSLAMIL